MSWTIEFGRETPKDGRWSSMTVHSEAARIQLGEHAVMGRERTGGWAGEEPPCPPS